MNELVLVFFIAIAMVYVPFILLIALAFILIWWSERKATARQRARDEVSMADRQATN
jgi:NADH:ubiquinone oxidoreductase subunit H